MSDISSIQRKWDNHYAQAHVGAPARVLSENAYLLPESGEALEVACGMGGNAVFLAQHGLDVHAWDISQVAVKKLQEYALSEKLTLIAEVRDSVQDAPAENSFDVIVVSHFLDRTLMPLLINALKPDGLLFYQTFSKLKVDDSGPSNPDFLLGDNELLSLCAPLRTVVYREEQRIGDVSKGYRNLVNYVGQKKA